eukprot:2086862-Rhodomonas_salina.1
MTRTRVPVTTVTCATAGSTQAGTCASHVSGSGYQPQRRSRPRVTAGVTPAVPNLTRNRT